MVKTAGISMTVGEAKRTGVARHKPSFVRKDREAAAAIRRDIKKANTERYTPEIEALRKRGIREGRYILTREPKPRVLKIIKFNAGLGIAECRTMQNRTSVDLGNIDRLIMPNELPRLGK